MATPTNPIERPRVLLVHVERECAELRRHALKHIAERGEVVAGQLAECLHQFLDIDPDLRGRDYTPKTERTRGGAS